MDPISSAEDHHKMNVKHNKKIVVQEGEKKENFKHLDKINSVKTRWTEM